MALREQTAVERRVWSGLPQGSALGLGGIAGLFQSATTLTAASCPTEAVSRLEQALADNGVIGGMIHARPYMASQLSNNYLIYEGPGRLKRTAIDTPYVFGRGYDGTGPAGQPVTSTVEYMYASGRIAIWQSDVHVPPPQQTLDRALNQQKVLAERIFAVTVECGVWAIAVTRDCTTD